MTWLWMSAVRTGWLLRNGLAGRLPVGVWSALNEGSLKRSIADAGGSDPREEATVDAHPGQIGRREGPALTLVASAGRGSGNRFDPGQLFEHPGARDDRAADHGRHGHRRPRHRD